MDLKALMGRLRDCTATFKAKAEALDEPLRLDLAKQFLVYSAFLTDLHSGKIAPSNRTELMLIAVLDFCQLIETELGAT